MKHTRLPRFKRSKDAADIELTDRDRQIVRLIYHHRFLRSSQIVALLQASSQPILRRLQLLYHHGYLERPRAQLDYFHHGGSKQIVYGLGGKGATVMKRELGKAFRPVLWGPKNRSIGRIFLEHALLVSDVMVALELACRGSGRVRLLTAKELQQSSEDQFFRWNVKIAGGVTLGVVPDRVFGLEFEGENGESKRAFFFLEADRGTMPVARSNLSQTSFYRKLLAYEATWSQGIHRKRFGFHRFRVLTVTKSSTRTQSLVDACSQLKRGNGLFLFADRAILTKPSEILFAPWRSGRNGEAATLLD